MASGACPSTSGASSAPASPSSARSTSDGFAEAETVELRGRHVVVEAFRLVGDDQHGPAAAAQELSDMQVLRRAALARVHHEQHAIGFFHRLQRLLGHQLFDTDDGLDETARVDHDTAARAGPRVAVLAVAGEPRHVRDERVARARERVEERGLADVRAPDESNDGQHVHPPAVPPIL
jgi:hypothetical protein